MGRDRSGIPREWGSGVMRETSYGDRRRVLACREWIAADSRVLDYGCGQGGLLRSMQIHCDMAGYDHDPSSPYFSWEDPVGRYDAVICSEVLEHQENPLELLSALRELVRPGGCCIITVPNGRGPYETLMRWTKTPNPHEQFFGFAELRELFHGAGFYISEYRGRSFLSGPIVSPIIDAVPGLARLNAWITNVLPVEWVSDWMFLLRRMDVPESADRDAASFQSV